MAETDGLTEDQEALRESRRRSYEVLKKVEEAKKQLAKKQEALDEMAAHVKTFLERTAAADRYRPEMPVPAAKSSRARAKA